LNVVKTQAAQRKLHGSTPPPATYIEWDGEDACLRFTNPEIPGLDPHLHEILTRLDRDGSGTIGIGELLKVQEEKAMLTTTRMFTFVFLCAICVLCCVVAVVAEDWANPLGTRGNRVVGPEGDMLTVSPATESIPVAWTPLLIPADLRRVTTLTLSDFSIDQAADGKGTTQSGAAAGSVIGSAGTGDDKACVECAKKLVFHVEVALRFNDTMLKFYSTQTGTTVTIDKGKITVEKLDGLDPKADPAVVYEACAQAKCSSIWISGIDVEALRQQAEALGYPTASRRGVGKAKQCKANQQHKAGQKDDGRFDNGEKSNSGQPETGG